MTHDDRPLDDEEWHEFLRLNDFGQLIVPQSDNRLPVVVPAHFAFDDEPALAVVLHLHRRNPAWAAIASTRRVMLSVVEASAYIPTYWLARDDDASGGMVPSSYYAAVQLSGPASVVEDADDLASLLTRQLRPHQPEGRHDVLERDGPYWPLLRGIRGLRIQVEEVRTKFKFGGNRTEPERRAIAARLEGRGAPHDASVREFVRRRGEASLEGGEPSTNERGDP